MVNVPNNSTVSAKISRALTFLALIFLAFSANAQHQSIPIKPVNAAPTQRSIPDDNLGYPVLISGPNFTGSGFYLNTADATFLVTAKHVLFDPASGNLRASNIEVRSYSRDPSDLSPNIFELNLSTLGVKGHPTQDVAVVKVATITGKVIAGAAGSVTFLPGVLIKAVSPNGIVSVNLDVVKKFDQILVGNNVIVFGYPTSLELKELAQLDPMRPLLRRGLVAGQNVNRHSIVLDCPVYPGNSGGPVIETDPIAFGYKLWVIGVVSEFVPFADSAKYFTMVSNSGYSIATPMDFVLEITH